MCIFLFFYILGRQQKYLYKFVAENKRFGNIFFFYSVNIYKKQQEIIGWNNILPIAVKLRINKIQYELFGNNSDFIQIYTYVLTLYVMFIHIVMNVCSAARMRYVITVSKLPQRNIRSSITQGIYINNINRILEVRAY